MAELCAELSPGAFVGLDDVATRYELYARIEANSRYDFVREGEPAADGVMVIVIEERATGTRYRLIYARATDGVRRWHLNRADPWDL